MDEKTKKILQDNVRNLRETAYNLEAGKLTTQELLDITQEFREEIAELIEGLAIRNEKILKQIEDKEELK